MFRRDAGEFQLFLLRKLLVRVPDNLFRLRREFTRNADAAFHCAWGYVQLLGGIFAERLDRLRISSAPCGSDFFALSVAAVFRFRVKRLVDFLPSEKNFVALHFIQRASDKIFVNLRQFRLKFVKTSDKSRDFRLSKEFERFYAMQPGNKRVARIQHNVNSPTSAMLSDRLLTTAAFALRRLGLILISVI